MFSEESSVCVWAAVGGFSVYHVTDELVPDSFYGHGNRGQWQVPQGLKVFNALGRKQLLHTYPQVSTHTPEHSLHTYTNTQARTHTHKRELCRTLIWIFSGHSFIFTLQSTVRMTIQISGLYIQQIILKLSHVATWQNRKSRDSGWLC